MASATYNLVMQATTPQHAASLVAVLGATWWAYGCAGGAQATALTEPSESLTPEAELEHRLDDYLARAYRPVGRPHVGELETIGDFSIPVEKGSCYVVLIRLGASASLSEHARKGTVTRLRIGDAEHRGAAGLNEAGGIGGGCVDESGEARFDVIANWGSATDDSRIHEIGTGPYSAQLMVRRLTEQQQRDREIAARRQQARWDDVERRRAVEACEFCGSSYELCVRDLVAGRTPTSGSCFEDSFHCLEGRGFSPLACLP